MRAPNRDSIPASIASRARAAALLVACAACTQQGLLLFPLTEARATGAFTEIRLEWTPAPFSDSTRIERSASAAGPFQPVGSDAAGSFTDRDLEAGSSYFYRLTPITSGGAEGPAAALEAFTGPLAPQAVVATSMVGGARVDWALSPHATSYQVIAGNPGGALSELSVVGPPALVPLPFGTLSLTVTAFSHGAPSPASAPVAASPIPDFVLSGTATRNSLVLRWPPVLGALGYWVNCRSGYPSLSDVTRATVISFDGLPAATQYLCRAGASLPSGEKSTRDLPISTLPEVPLAVVLTLAPRSLGARLSWRRDGRATSYTIYRSEQAAGPLVPIATIAPPGQSPGAAFLDTQVQAWKRYWYAVQGNNLSGAGPVDLAAPVSCIVLGLPDADNEPGSSAPFLLLGPAVDPGQELIAHQAGLLSGVELAINGAKVSGSVQVFVGPVQVAAASVRDLVLTGSPFEPDADTAYFDLRPSAFRVVAGERLRFELRTDSGLLYQGAAFPDGALLESGLPQPGRSLSFRSFIEPDAPGALGPMGPSISSDWHGTVHLVWGATPGAQGYRLDRAIDGAPFATVGQSLFPVFVDQPPLEAPIHYRLAALKGGAEIATDLRSFHLDRSAADQVNLGDLTSAFRTGWSAEQTFTVGRSGYLTALELSLIPAEQSSGTAASVTLIDPAGVPTSLDGGFQLFREGCCTPPPLVPGVAGPALFAVSPPIAVQAGQQWKLRVFCATGCYMGAGPDRYAGGSATIGGYPRPDLDLWFRTTVY